MSEVVAVYGDGGVDGANPSPHGGSWAWVHVGADGAAVGSGVGYVTPADAGLPAVSNNLTELLAVLHGIESLPAGWTGAVWTDSAVTRGRLARPFKAKFAGIPEALVHRVRAAAARLGPGVDYLLLGGHPTRAELAAGRRADGMPVSAWNVYCDRRCTAVIAARRAAANPVS